MSRWVKVATIATRGRGGNVEEKRKHGLNMLEQAAMLQPDIVCLPETFTGLGCGSKEWFSTAEPIPGPTTDAVAAIARQHSMYVVCPILQHTSSAVYNCAALIDRNGELVGLYHKVHPTVTEIELGVVPGIEAPVFETDFGRVGLAICFDLNFQDVGDALAQGDAEIVFFPSMYCGGLQLAMWAHGYHFFLASAHSGGRSAILDPLGRVLKWSSDYEPILCRDINLDGRVLHIDFNQDRWADIRREYSSQVEIDVATDEAKFRLVSNHPTMSVDEIIRQFGLETLKEYWVRSNRAREESLARQAVQE